MHPAAVNVNHRAPTIGRAVTGALPGAALLGAALVALAACGSSAPRHGVALEPPEAAPALALPVATAAGPAGAFDLQRATRDSARAALVFFGYTHCPDVCPTTLADWKQVRATLGADAARVRFVFVTVDPERDSAAVVRRYVAQFDSTFIGLAGPRAQVDRVQAAWGVGSYREGEGAAGGYTVAHPARFFAVDAAGRLRASYALATPAADVADDLRRLLRARAAEGGA